MRKLFPGCHVEPSRNAMAAWNYCGKDDSREEGPLDHGVPPAAKNVKGDTAARNKLILEQGAVKAVEDGLVPIEKFKQLRQSMELFYVMKKAAVSLDRLENEWHWGSTGTGKSRTVRTKWPEAFIKSNDIWWDGYAGEETVIIEELGPKQINGHHIKLWMDHYPFKAATKGGMLFIRPKRIIVTSNYTVEECWDQPQDNEPIRRRLTVHHYEKQLYN